MINKMLAQSTGIVKVSCPKCKGQLSKEKDFYGSYLECLQCGYTKVLKKGE